MTLLLVKVNYPLVAGILKRDDLELPLVLAPQFLISALISPSLSNTNLLAKSSSATSSLIHLDSYVD